MLRGVWYLFRSLFNDDKRGSMELEEIIKIVIFIVVLVVVISGIFYLLLGRGGRILESISDSFRFR